MSVFVVLSHLDEMKKDVAQARDATRWLEAEMRKGSRFVQVLGPGEVSVAVDGIFGNNNNIEPL